MAPKWAHPESWGSLNKLVALNFISVFLFSLRYQSNRVIALGVSSVFFWENF